MENILSALGTLFIIGIAVLLGLVTLGLLTGIDPLLWLLPNSDERGKKSPVEEDPPHKPRTIFQRLVCWILIVLGILVVTIVVAFVLVLE